MYRKYTSATAGFLLILITVIFLGAVSSATAKEVHALLIILGNDVNIRKSVEKSEGPHKGSHEARLTPLRCPSDCHEI